MQHNTDISDKSSCLSDPEDSFYHVLPTDTSITPLRENGYIHKSYFK